MAAFSQNEGGKTMSAKGSQSEQQSTSAQDSVAIGQGSSSTAISGDQLPFLQNLWSQATGALPGGQADVGATADVNAGFLQQAMQTLGGLGDPSAQIEQQTSALSSGLGKLFREEMLPAIAGNAIQAGGFGGGREGVAQAGAVGNIADAFTQGSADITAGANAQAIQAQSLMPGLAQANLGNTQSGAFGPLQALAGILGGPAMTSQSENRNLALSQGRSQSSGESSSFGVGFGGLFG